MGSCRSAAAVGIGCDVHRAAGRRLASGSQHLHRRRDERCEAPVRRRSSEVTGVPRQDAGSSLQVPIPPWILLPAIATSSIRSRMFTTVLPMTNLSHCRRWRSHAEHYPFVLPLQYNGLLSYYQCLQIIVFCLFTVLGFRLWRACPVHCSLQMLTVSTAVDFWKSKLIILYKYFQ